MRSPAALSDFICHAPKHKARNSATLYKNHSKNIKALSKYLSLKMFMLSMISRSMAPATISAVRGTSAILCRI